MGGRRKMDLKPVYKKPHRAQQDSNTYIMKIVMHLKKGASFDANHDQNYSTSRHVHTERNAVVL